MVRKRHLISIWSLLTLVVIGVGAASVFSIGQIYFMRWAQTGKRIPVSQRAPIELPAERILVYYESPHSVPRDRASLYVWDPYNERILPGTPEPQEEREFRIWFNDWQGRVLWVLDLQEAGLYTITCTNANFPSDADVPAEDRLVFMKSPETVNQVDAHVKVLKVTFGSATFFLAMLTYGMHLWTLRRRRLRQEQQEKETAA